MRKILLFLVIGVVVVGLCGTAFLYWFFSGDGLRHAIEEQATAWLGQPVTIGRARAAIFPRTAIRLVDVRIGEPARVSLANVDVSTDFRELISRRIQDAAITISNSRIEMPLPFALPDEGDTTTANASGAPSTPAIEIV